MGSYTHWHHHTTSGPNADDLGKLKKPKLVKKAGELGIELDGKETKAELVALILAPPVQVDDGDNENDGSETASDVGTTPETEG